MLLHSTYCCWHIRITKTEEHSDKQDRGDAVLRTLRQWTKVVDICRVNTQANIETQECQR